MEYQNINCTSQKNKYDIVNIINHNLQSFINSIHQLFNDNMVAPLQSMINDEKYIMEYYQNKAHTINYEKHMYNHSLQHLLDRSYTLKNDKFLHNKKLASDKIILQTKKYMHKLILKAKLYCNKFIKHTKWNGYTLICSKSTKIKNNHIIYKMSLNNDKLMVKFNSYINKFVNRERNSKIHIYRKIIIKEKCTCSKNY